MPEELPDPSWIVRALREARELAKELAPWAAVVAAGFAGCQSWKNADTITTAKTEVIAKADDAAVKADAAREVGVLNTDRLKKIESKLK